MSSEATKSLILKKIKRAQGLIPKQLEPDLPPTQLLPDVAEWHSYEHEIWKLGAEIRQLIATCPSLRNDEELNTKIVSICLNPNTKRGRQSFIMLLGYKQHSNFAPDLIAQVTDGHVTGHILDTISKMKISGYSHIMRQYTDHETTWIKNVAKRYLTQYAEK